MAQSTLTSQELIAVMMGLDELIQSMDEVFANNVFNNEARKSAREIIAASKSARVKLESLVGQKFVMEPYKKGDEEEFINPHIKNPLS